MTIVQPADLGPADWLRAVEVTFADDEEVVHLGKVLADRFDDRIRLSTASLRTLAKAMGGVCSRRRVSRLLMRLEAHSAITRTFLDRLPIAIRRLCSRQGSGRVTALSMRWACEVLYPVNAIANSQQAQPTVALN